MEVPNDIKELKAITTNIAATGEALNEYAATTNQQLNKMADGINALVQGIAEYKTVRGYKSIEGMMNGLRLTQWVWSGEGGLRAGELVNA